MEIIFGAGITTAVTESYNVSSIMNGKFEQFCATGKTNLRQRAVSKKRISIDEYNFAS